MYRFKKKKINHEWSFSFKIYINITLWFLYSLIVQLTPIALVL